MKKLSLKALKTGVSGLQARVVKARSHYDQWKGRLRELDSAEAKRDFTPLKIQTMKAEARSEALKEIRDLKAGMAELATPALGQRRRWTKSALLRDTKFSEAPDFLRGDRVSSAQFELLNAVKELNARTWAQRLPNDSLLEAIQDAVAGEELAVLSVLVSESELRGDGKLKIQTNETLKGISFPEVAEAEAAFTAMERSLKEVDALENELLDPTSTAARGKANFFAWSRMKETQEPEPEQTSAA